MIDLNKFRLQYITNSNEKYSHIEGAKFVLEGGCKWIQLRIKIENEIDKQYEKIIATAAELKDICKKYDATFIVDDYVDIAKKIQADGVHLGKNDMPIKEARKILDNN
jgi:thiamine-phosphate pyrophosphorylase